jgi:hypothetical protein
MFIISETEAPYSWYTDLSDLELDTISHKFHIIIVSSMSLIINIRS